MIKRKYEPDCSVNAVQQDLKNGAEFMIISDSSEGINSDSDSDDELSEKDNDEE